MVAFNCADEFLAPGVGDYIREKELYIRPKPGLTEKELEAVVVSLLKENRVAHVLGCRDTAVRLAEKWGADPVDAARAALAKFDTLFARLKAAPAGDALLAEATAAAAAGKADFTAAVSEDLNISKALSALFVLVKTAGRLLAEGVQASGAEVLLDQFRDFDRVFGALDVDVEKKEEAPAVDAPAEVLELVAARTEAKKAKDFAKADAIRDQLKKMGWSVVDKPTGPVPVKL
jgi:cysteinyl-tRNA synthetase